MGVLEREEGEWGGKSRAQRGWGLRTSPRHPAGREGGLTNIDPIIRVKHLFFTNLYFHITLLNNNNEQQHQYGNIDSKEKKTYALYHTNKKEFITLYQDVSLNYVRFLVYYLF